MNKQIQIGWVLMLSTLLISCQKGNVQIGNPTASQPQTLPQVNTLENSQPNSSSNIEVFFRAGQISRRNQMALDLLGFLPAESRTSEAFVFHLPHAQGETTSLGFRASGPAQVLVIESNLLSGQAQISSLNIQNFSKHLVQTLPNPKLTALSADRGRMAWVDIHGQLSILDLQTQVSQNIAWAGAPILAIKSIPKSADFLFLAGGREGQVVRVTNGQTQVLSSVAQPSALAVNEDGSRVLVATATNVQICELSACSFRIAANSANVLGLDWVNSEQFVTVQDTGLIAGISVFDLGANTEIKLAEVPGGASASLVCPIGLNGDVFYAAPSDNKLRWVIQKASKKSGQWKSQVFAENRDRDLDYVCPEVGVPL